MKFPWDYLFLSFLYMGVGWALWVFNVVHDSFYIGYCTGGLACMFGSATLECIKSRFADPDMNPRDPEGPQRPENDMEEGR